MLQIPAYAKLNLSLDVLGRRPDGYHTVRMVMQSISLHDTLFLEKTEQQGIFLSGTNEALHPDITWDEKNLVYKAAKLFLEHYPQDNGIKITVDKQIPSAAGLAGGSSDAAATLKGMNELFGVHASQKELQMLGVRIGADVPYCLQSGTALAEGIGELLTTFPAAPSLYCTLVKPALNISTKYVYEHLDETFADALHPDTDAMLAALAAHDAGKLCAALGNILEPVTLALCPVITEIEQKLLSFGALAAQMTGSGPTVFGLFQQPEAAERAAGYFREHGFPDTSFACKFL